MSNINTGAIDINYPVPGQNNSTQPFRDNFTSIKTNLDTAASEISNLQNNAIFKSSIDGVTLNNDMNNTLITNALVQGFRSTTYNLGNNLSGTVNIDVSKADVHYGTITNNIVLTFSKWAPTGTSARVELILSIATGSSTSTISFPSNVDASKLNIENYNPVGSVFSITAPRDVTKLHWIIETQDCGTTLTITPVNRPSRTAQILSGTPVTGNVITSGTITTATGTSIVNGTNTAFLTELVVGRQITDISGNVIGTVLSITSNTLLTLSSNAALSLTNAVYRATVPIGQQGDRLGTTMTDGTYLYVCTGTFNGSTGIWKRISLASY